MRAFAFIAGVRGAIRVRVWRPAAWAVIGAIAAALCARASLLPAALGGQAASAPPVSAPASAATSVGAGDRVAIDDPAFAARQSKVLDLLSRSTRRRASWDMLFASLRRADDASAQKALAALNDYLANSPELDYNRWNGPANEPDWRMNSLVRTWHQFRGQLSDAATARLRDIFAWYRNGVSFGGTENHIINRTVLTLLADQAMGTDDAKTAAARVNYRRWIYNRGRRGYMEFNSANYHGRAMMPLLLACDFLADDSLAALARKALDQFFAEMAVESVGGVLGGPWHRAVSPQQIRDARYDTAYMATFVMFGHGGDPVYDVNDAHLAATTYRPPLVVADLATRIAARGSYAVRHRVDTVDPKLDAYFWVTPEYVLACFQNRPPFANHYYGSSNLANLQPWELQLADPRNILGVARSLTDVKDYDNPNTAVMQYRNVLVYAGKTADYNGTLGTPRQLAAPAGAAVTLYVVDHGDAQVFVGLTDFGDGGILEAASSDDFADAGAFAAALEKSAAGAGYADGGRSVRYTSTRGDMIAIAGSKASVNGEPFALGGYDLCDSPYVKSTWDSGLWDISFGGRRLTLDFADPTVRAGRGLLGEYFAAADFSGPAVRRVDYEPDFNWGAGPPVPGAAPGAFSARWSGWLLPDFTGEHRFYVKTDGAVRLWVDGKLIIDQGPASAPASTPAGNADGSGNAEMREPSGAANLTAGRACELKLEYAHGAGQAVMLLSSSSPMTGKETMGMRGELFEPASRPAK